MNRFLNTLPLLLISIPSFASNILEVGNKKYAIQLQEIACVNGASDLFNTVTKVIHDEMTKAGCNLQSKVDSSVDCSRIDDKYLLRSFIISHLREKNYCNCQRGPVECAAFCSKTLLLEECTSICGGSCGISYPRQ